MRAAVLPRFGAPLHVEEVADPVLGSGEVIVDVAAAPVLPYAAEVFSGERRYDLVPPVVPGAGGVGRVREVGPDATRLAPGDWVFCDPTVRSRDDAVTPDIALQGLSARGEGGRRLARHHHDGAFAERTRVPTENAFALGPIVPAEAGTWCALGLCLVPYGGLAAVDLRPGETALVSGATGNYGSAGVAVALAMGARAVVTPGRDVTTLDDLVRRFGDRVRPVVLTGDEDTDRERMVAAAPAPIDVVLDLLPPSAPAAVARAAAMTVREYGRVALMGGVGMLGGDDLALPYPWLMRRSVTVRGQWMYRPADVPRLIGIARAGLLDLCGTTGERQPGTARREVRCTGQDTAVRVRVVSADALLVNFFYAHPVGHVIEALHYAVGHRAARPDRPVALALNAASPTELAGLCPAVSTVHAIDHPLLESCPDSAERARNVAGEWGWVCDDFRRHQQIQVELFPGLADYYGATDSITRPRHPRTVVGADDAGYLPHQPVRLELPAPAREAAAGRLHGQRARLALLPAGSSESSLYPSAGSWLLVLDALLAAIPDLEVVLIGRSAGGDRTATSIDPDDHARLLAHLSRPVDGFDLDLPEQLALVEACDVFLSPHSGFGMAALAVGTPWLTLSGGRWFEYFFNHVPFRSILPDTGRWSSFSQFDPAALAVDDDGAARTPSMTRARIAEDLDRVTDAAVELVAQRLDYEQALADYFPALLAAHQGDPSAIWSLDALHTAYI